MTIRKPSHRVPVPPRVRCPTRSSAARRRARTRRRPRRRPTATAPRRGSRPSAVISALASSISSRTSTVDPLGDLGDGAASVRWLAVRSAGKALEDQRQDEAAGERGADAISGRSAADQRAWPSASACSPVAVGGDGGGGATGRPPAEAVARRSGSASRRSSGHRRRCAASRLAAAKRRLTARPRSAVPRSRVGRLSGQLAARRRRLLAAAAAAARSLGRVFAEHALPDHGRHARRGDARERAEPGEQARPQQALDQRALRHRRGIQSDSPSTGARRAPLQAAADRLDDHPSSPARARPRRPASLSKIQPVSTCSIEP